MNSRKPSLSDLFPDFRSPDQLKWWVHADPKANLLTAPVPPVEPTEDIEVEVTTDVLLAAALESAIPDDEED